MWCRPSVVDTNSDSYNFTDYGKKALCGVDPLWSTPISTITIYQTMGRRLRTLASERSLFFVTFSTLNRTEVFHSDETLTTVDDTLFEVVKNKSCYLMGYVIMPNHLHLLIGFIKGGPELSLFMISLKGLIRKRIVGNDRLWEKRFDDLVINTDKQFKIKLDYIHNNPVKRGLVSNPGDWKYSSFSFWNSDEEHPVLRRDFKWME